MSESPGTEIVIAPVELGVLHASRPKEFGVAATEVANALAEIIESRKLYSVIQGKRYVRVEGWTTLAAMLGCLPREVSVTKHDDGGYTAVVELARMSDGAILTRASAECGMDEKTWAQRDAYARRSMAITRATSKACRIAYSWAIVLAGFEGTPSEEMPRQPTGVSDDGEFVLPGNAKKWGGFGGQALDRVPEPVLVKCRDWHTGKSLAPELVDAINEELESRRTVGEGATPTRPGASEPSSRPDPTTALPHALVEDDELDALQATVERLFRSATGVVPEGKLALIASRFKAFGPVPTATQLEGLAGSLEKAIANAKTAQAVEKLVTP